MAKLLLLSFLLLFSNSLYSQVYDKTEDDLRIVVSDTETLYSRLMDAGTFHLSFAKSLTNEDIKIWTLHMSLYEGKMTIDKDRLLLIKFKDGTIMELKNVAKIGKTDYEYRVTFSNRIEYYVEPSYELSEKDLLKLCKNDILKIRIENDMSYFDRKIDSWKFKKRINKMYNQIKGTLNSSNDVRKGF